MKPVLALLLFFTGASSAVAQLQSLVKFDYDVYALHQPVEFELTLRNLGGQVLNFSELKDQRAQIRFVLKGSDGHEVARTEEQLLDELLIVTPRETVKRSFNLTRKFNIQKEGAYSFRVHYRINGRLYGSKIVYFSLSRGQKLKSLDSYDPPRKYELFKITRRAGEFIFLSNSTDARDQNRKKTSSVYELGRLVDHIPPEILSDSRGRIHVLHCARPNHFLHTAFSAAGRPLLQDMYAAELGPARLKISNDGTAYVAGGRKL